MEEQERTVWQELLDEIRAAIREAVSLKISTIVGDIEWVDKRTAPNVTNSDTMYTEIDLVQGDLVSMIDRAFLDPDMSGLRDYHKAREDQAYEIIESNIKALKELGEYVKELRDGPQE
jgi:hypothetical protein